MSWPETSNIFWVMGPDEAASNRLDALFEVTDRAWVADTVPGYDQLAVDGRVMDVLSVLIDLDRLHLVMDGIDRALARGANAVAVRQEMADGRLEARRHTPVFGEDSPELSGWTWPH